MTLTSSREKKYPSIRSLMPTPNRRRSQALWSKSKGLRILIDWNKSESSWTRNFIRSRPNPFKLPRSPWDRTRGSSKARKLSLTCSPNLFMQVNTKSNWPFFTSELIWEIYWKHSRTHRDPWEFSWIIKSLNSEMKEELLKKSRRTLKEQSKRVATSVWLSSLQTWSLNTSELRKQH